MLTSLEWFLLIALTSISAGGIGMALGRGTPRRWRLAMVLSVVALAACVWMVRHPAVSVRLIPLEVVSHLEGVAPVPIVMLLLGLAWSISRVPRQRAMVAMGGVVTAGFFVWGGMWMLQNTPEDAFDNSFAGGPVMQSQSYSCVAATTASTLNLLGLSTTEAEMASLTRTRAGMGATNVRALQGIRQRLIGTGYGAELVEASFAELEAMPVPAITSLRLARSNLHMVTLLQITPNGAWVLDPQEGCIFYEADELRGIYNGELIVFSNTTRGLGRSRGTTPPQPAPPDATITTVAALGG